MNFARLCFLLAGATWPLLGFVGHARALLECPQFGAPSDENLEDIKKTSAKFISSLERFQNEAVEIVFVLDSSGSVGAPNFGCEVQFVHYFSRLFGVSEDTSRVSVVTYSSCNKIYIDVDYIRFPVAKNKCTLLGRDLDDVVYREGGTCTVDGLRRAHEILAGSRQSAPKIVFVLTDGKSNDGGSPLNVAASLKSTATVFAIGVGEGISKEELIGIASSPQEDYVFYLDLLADVKRLAQRVTGDDNDMASWDRNVNSDLCKSLCTEGRDCCDAQASCSCATQTGSYGCACHPGTHGSGKAGDCVACPRGTYKPQYGNQACTACPTLATTMAEGSTDLSACSCQLGHTGNPQMKVPCKPITCELLSFSASSGVSIIPLDCGNVYETTCQMQCQLNYRSVPDTMESVQCLDNGEWSGTPLQCSLIRCEPLHAPTNGLLHCDTDREWTIGSVCDLSCSEGYDRTGQERTRCTLNEAQNIGEWLNEVGACEAKSCIPLVVGVFMEIEPVECRSQPQEYRSRCQYSCSSGFILQGVRTKTCLADGQWSNSSVANVCVDDEPPTFIRCPNHKRLLTDPRKNYATLSLEKPEARDNSGKAPFVEGSASSEQERFMLGVVTTVTYTARDYEGHESTCSFDITVADREPPRVTNCSEDIVEESIDFHVSVSWPEPQFVDNSEGAVSFTVNRAPGSEFSWGVPEQIYYRASDPDGNIAFCNFTVAVKQYPCDYYPPPVNGALACDKFQGGQFCLASCNENFDFHKEPSDLYYCRTASGMDRPTWGPNPLKRRPTFSIPWPDCTTKRYPAVKVTMELRYFAESCQFSLDEIKADFIARFGKLGKNIPGFCDPDQGCTVEYVEVTCGVAQDGRRRKRQLNSVLNVLFGIAVNPPSPSQRTPITADANSTDGQNSITVMESFIDAMDDVVSSGQLNVLIGEGQEAAPSGPVDVLGPLVLTCGRGEVLRNTSCVACPAGMYFQDGGSCSSCDIGFYQDLEGQLECKRCPRRTTTQSRNSRRREDCKAPCARGTYSSTGIETCVACPRGTYQPDQGASSCLACPSDLTTWTEGATSSDQCTGECPAGTYSGTGFATCSPCPRGTYQPGNTQTSCLACPDGTYTHREQAHAIQYCQVINECVLSDPCLNGGHCIDLPEGYRCDCRPGFVGPDCATNVDDCYQHLCINNGTCVDLVDGYHCICPVGYEGQQCQINVDECISNPCRNGASCVDGPYSYTCQCRRGFAGPLCEVNLFDCQSSPCLNDGTCIDKDEDFTCCCRAGYRGRHCETLVDECQSSPCKNNATCVAAFNSMMCVCLPGFTGNRCEVEIDECDLHQVVCQHGGNCRDMVNDFQCTCRPGYEGNYCETALSANFDVHFAVAETSNYVMITDNLPGMYSFTVSFWMRTSDVVNRGTPVSYATRQADGSIQDNALTISDYNSVVIFVNGKSTFTDVAINSDSNWHHAVITWASRDGHWSVFVDGTLRRSGTDYQTGEFIRGDGVLILGQEQDSLAGSFAQSQSFVGYLSQLNIWDYELTREEITSVYSSCAMSGNVVSWSQAASRLHGAITMVSNSLICQDVIDCHSSTCQNDATCEDLPGSYACHCALGYHGTHCELASVVCASDTCRNGGSCRTSTTGGVTLFCVCPPEYTGERCEVPADPCESLVCPSAATCGHDGPLPKCICSPGFTGRHCDYDVNECLSNNGGCEDTCINTVGSYNCACSTGFALQTDGHSCYATTYCSHNGRFHLAGEDWEFGCSRCRCENGITQCEVKTCPETNCPVGEYEYESPGSCCTECLPASKTCSVSSKGKHKTYDGNRYDHTGNCRYVLSQDCAGNTFAVEISYQATKRKIKAQAIWVRLDCVEVEIAFDGAVKVTGSRVQLPYTHAEPENLMITQTNSSSTDDDGSILIKTNRGVVVRWSKYSSEVIAPGTFAGRLCGLCGDMNGKRKDDRRTRQFLPARSAREFTHSWKVDGYKYCGLPEVRNLTKQAFGAIKINRIPTCAGSSYSYLKEVRRKCSILRKREFQPCHGDVNPTSFFEWCIGDACVCNSNEPCHCEAIMAYIYECERKGFNTLSMVDNTCSVQCPEGMIYDQCGPTCIPTCEDPAPSCQGTPTCIPKCQCPAGTVLFNDACILPSYCPQTNDK